MFTYPNIDPVAISLGPMKIHWYGITYLIAFVGGWFLAKYRASKTGSGWHPDEVADVVFYIALGVILGGRIGSILFYNFSDFIANPLMLLKIWEGGMSFHGGFIGVAIAFFLYARNTGRSFFQVADFLAPMFPLGLGAGRIGNFINGELWGRVTDVPWGMVYPNAGPLPRHPNQIYQFVCEGIILFAIVWLYSRKPRPTMAVSGLFVMCYGIYRFLIEFVREPDAHLGFIAFDWMTMGQLLSLPMMLIGAGLMYWAYKKNDFHPQTVPSSVASSFGETASTAGTKPGKKTKAKRSKGA